MLGLFASDGKRRFMRPVKGSPLRGRYAPVTNRRSGPGVVPQLNIGWCQTPRLFPPMLKSGVSPSNIADQRRIRSGISCRDRKVSHTCLRALGDGRNRLFSGQNANGALGRMSGLEGRGPAATASPLTRQRVGILARFRPRRV